LMQFLFTRFARILPARRPLVARFARILPAHAIS
jgi:hypothetical protein